MKRILIGVFFLFPVLSFAQGGILRKFATHTDDIMKMTAKHGDDIAKVLVIHSDDAARIFVHGDDLSKLMLLHSDDLARLGLKADDIAKLGLKEGDDILRNYSKILASQENIAKKIKSTPTKNGLWSGVRGNSTFKIDLDSIPKRANSPSTPKSFRELLEIEKMKSLDLQNLPLINKNNFKQGIEDLLSGKGINYINGEPDFHSISLATVEIPQSAERYGIKGTMRAADGVLAKKLGIGTQELRIWINNNQFVWHELGDGLHAQLLPHAIHGNLGHSGGIAANKLLQNISIK